MDSNSAVVRNIWILGGASISSQYDAREHLVDSSRRPGACVRSISYRNRNSRLSVQVADSIGLRNVVEFLGFSLESLAGIDCHWIGSYMPVRRRPTYLSHHAGRHMLDRPPWLHSNGGRSYHFCHLNEQFSPAANKNSRVELPPREVNVALDIEGLHRLSNDDIGRLSSARFSVLRSARGQPFASRMPKVHRIALFWFSRTTGAGRNCSCSA